MSFPISFRLFLSPADIFFIFFRAIFPTRFLHIASNSSSFLSFCRTSLSCQLDIIPYLLNGLKDLHNIHSSILQGQEGLYIRWPRTFCPTKEQIGPDIICFFGLGLFSSQALTFYLLYEPQTWTITDKGKKVYFERHSPAFCVSCHDVVYESFFPSSLVLLAFFGFFFFSLIMEICEAGERQLFLRGP